MAKLSRKELEDIIKRDLPGARLIGRGSTAPSASAKRTAPEGATPELDVLQRKYSDAATAESAQLEDAATDTDADDEDEIVLVDPHPSDDPLDRGARAKAVVVSGRQRKVIGSQG